MFETYGIEHFWNFIPAISYRWQQETIAYNNERCLTTTNISGIMTKKGGLYARVFIRQCCY